MLNKLASAPLSENGVAIGIAGGDIKHEGGVFRHRNLSQDVMDGALLASSLAVVFSSPFHCRHRHKLL